MALQQAPFPTGVTAMHQTATARISPCIPDCQSAKRATQVISSA